MNIEGKLVRIRAIEREDLEYLQAWSNDPYVQDQIGPIHFPSSRDYHIRWFEKLKDDQLNQRFAIETITDKTLIGLTSFVNIDWKNNHAWHGLTLGNPTSRGKGYGTDALMTSLRYAFDELHFERLDGGIIKYNEISNKLYCGRCGWKYEGTRRQYFFRKGRYWDYILIGITRQDYTELLEKSRYWEGN